MFFKPHPWTLTIGLSKLFFQGPLDCINIEGNFESDGVSIQSTRWTRPVEKFEGSPFRSCDFLPEGPWRVLAHRTPDPSRSRVLFTPPILVKSRPGGRQPGIRDRWRGPRQTPSLVSASGSAQSLKTGRVFWSWRRVPSILRRGLGAVL